MQAQPIYLFVSTGVGPRTTNRRNEMFKLIFRFFRKGVKIVFEIELRF
jgi:hypothetical protein